MALSLPLPEQRRNLIKAANEGGGFFTHATKLGISFVRARVSFMLSWHYELHNSAFAVHSAKSVKSLLAKSSRY